MNELTNRNLIDQATGLENFTESTETVLTAGTSSGLYAYGDIVELDAYVPPEYAARGWYFDRWVDTRNVGSKVNCDPQDTGGNHYNRVCKFQIWQDLSIDLYFKDDTGPPMTALGGTPTAGTTTGSTSAEVTFDSNQSDARFQCRLERDASVVHDWFLCGGPADKSQAFTGLTTSGQYTALVRALDPSDQAGEPFSRSWRVDNDFPNTSITGGPTTVGGANASFTFTATETSTFACQLDSGPWTACTSPRGLSDLPEGPHTFRVVATDGYGHTDATPAERAWTVDRTPPETVLLEGPGEGTTTPTSSATFTFASPESGMTFECRIDDQAFAPCTSPHTRESIPNGDRVFEVRAKDGGGNVDASPARRAWRVNSLDEDADGINRPQDCNDTDAAVKPGATDVPGNGIDEDCSGADATAPAQQPGGGTQTQAQTQTQTTTTGGGTATDGALTPALPPLLPAPAAMRASVAHRLSLTRRGTIFRRLAVQSLPAGSTVTVRCKGSSCPRRSLTKSVSGALLLKPFTAKLLKPGTRLTIVISAPGFTTKTVTYLIRAGRKPKVGQA